MNHEEMSDFEINKEVAKLIGAETYDDGKIVSASIPRRGDNVISVVGAVDYCNNPSDAWPIILANKIDVQHRDGFNMPCARHCEHMAADKNPIRAAMIVFLMMKGVGCQKP